MFSWRVTKYDPGKRDKRGAYTAPDWTSCTDIGCAFDGKVLDRSEYLHVETAYVEAARHFLRDFGDEPLTIVYLESHDIPQNILDLGFHDALRIDALPSEGETVAPQDIDRICRLNLRSIIWCKLEASRGRFYIHFGYDFYMYIGSQVSSEDAIRSARASGLFVEPMPSPYLRPRTLERSGDD